MSLHRWVYKTHKWLAVGAGLFTFLWFASGIVMILPSPLLRRGSISNPGDARLPPMPAFRDVTVSLREAIASAESVAGQRIEVTGVRFRRLLGHLVYEISTAEAGIYLIDAVDGKRVVITEDLAREIAARALGGRGRVRGVSLLREHDRRYETGPLPVYRIAVDDSKGSVLYVAVQTGETSFTTRLGGIRAFIAGTHTFAFLRPFLPGWSTRFTLLAFSVVGLLMSVFGGCILWLQFKSWWRSCRRTT